jgi:hypothetical protein
MPPVTSEKEAAEEHYPHQLDFHVPILSAQEVELAPGADGGVRPDHRAARELVVGGALNPEGC